jgi:excisionase family DNA binding protein
MSTFALCAAERIAFNGVREAAEATGLKPHHIRQAIASGELRSHAVSRRTVILRDDLIAFIRNRPAPKSSRAQYNEESPQ